MVAKCVFFGIDYRHELRYAAVVSGYIEVCDAGFKFASNVAVGVVVSNIDMYTV